MCQFGSIHLCSSLTCPWVGGLWGQGWSSALCLFLGGSKPKPSQWWAATFIPLKAPVGGWLDLVFKHLTQSYPFNAWNPVQGLSSHFLISFQNLLDNSGAAKSQHWGKKTTKEPSLITWADTWTTCFHLVGFFSRANFNFVSKFFHL